MNPYRFVPLYVSAVPFSPGSHSRSPVTPFSPVAAADVPPARRLFEELLGPDRINALAPSPPHTTYTAFLTLWLLIYQRLHGHGTLADAVAHLQAVRRPGGGHHAPPSANTGGYNHARQRLAGELVNRVADHLFDALVPSSPHERRVFALGGSTLSLAPTPALRHAYPPATNQHGTSHWPILHVGVAHDIDTGLAVRPESGPMYGPHAVSEMDLATALISRLPAGSVVLGDANFGVFRLAYEATRTGHPALVRLTAVRFRALKRSAVPVRPGMWSLTWEPSRYERRAHPELPRTAAVRGWLHECVVDRGPRDGPLTVWLFTTVAEWDTPAAAAVYKRRLNVETDLRSLKCSLRVGELSGRTPPMVGKELVVAVMTMNLVNQVRRLVAQKAELAPRRFGFNGIWSMVRTLLEEVTRGVTGDELDRLLDRLVETYSRVRLPVRKTFRSYPREVIPRGRQYKERKRLTKC